MAKAYVPQVVTANLLLSGRSVFLGADEWTSDIALARIAGDAHEAHELLEHALKQPGLVVGPYLVDVTIGEDSRPVPVEMRERMRVTGPSIDVSRERYCAQANGACTGKRIPGQATRYHHKPAGHDQSLTYADPWMGF